MTIAIEAVAAAEAAPGAAQGLLAAAEATLPNPVCWRGAENQTTKSLRQAQENLNLS